MRNILLLPAFLFLSIVSFCQNTDLTERLNGFVKANNEMNFDKILDFTYPKVFTLATREQMKEVLQSTFDGEELKMEMDSISITKVSPVFISGDGTYAKVHYSFLMFMNFTTSDPLEKESLNESMLETLGERYGTYNVSIDPIKKAIKIKVNSEMAAIKDEYAKEWCFMDLLNNKAMNDMMLDKNILEKLATFN